MADCENTDGVWGQPCPGCGVVLPDPPRIRSWKSQQPVVYPSGSSAGLGARHPGQIEAWRRRRGPKLPGAVGAHS